MSRPSTMTGLSAFPLTPADPEGTVDVDALGVLVDRLVLAGVDSICLLGSTGGYAYLERGERSRALAAASEALAGRVPLMVGVGAMRTSWAIQLAREAERAGADAVLLAPMSYTPLTDDEALTHYEAVAAATDLPLCVYNNPGTTHFTFSDTLIERLAVVPNVAGIKMPPPGGAFDLDIARLRELSGPSFSVGYSGDWNLASAMSSGADAFYSAISGTLPGPAVRLTRALKAGRSAEVGELRQSMDPLLSLCRAHGSLRIAYAVAHHLGLEVGCPPAPVMPVGKDMLRQVADSLDRLTA
ncbi:dihydrodipicolinate synthase family protein [Sphingomonas sp. UYP23]